MASSGAAVRPSPSPYYGSTAASGTGSVGSSSPGGSVGGNSAASTRSDELDRLRREVNELQDRVNQIERTQSGAR